MNNLTKNLVLWLVIAMVLMAVFNNFAPEQNRSGQEIDYSVFLDEVERGSVEQVTIDGAAIYIRARNGERYVTYSPGDPGLVNDLLKADIAIKAQKEEEPSLLMQIFISWVMPITKRATTARPLINSVRSLVKKTNWLKTPITTWQNATLKKNEKPLL